MGVSWRSVVYGLTTVQKNRRKKELLCVCVGVIFVVLYVSGSAVFLFCLRSYT
jgi:flagellar basal body-associated protein FliL